MRKVIRTWNVVNYKMLWTVFNLKYKDYLLCHCQTPVRGMLVRSLYGKSPFRLVWDLTQYKIIINFTFNCLICLSMDHVFLMDPLNFNGHIGFAPRDGNVSTLDPFSTSVWKTEQWSHESQFKGLWALWQVKKKKKKKKCKKKFQLGLRDYNLRDLPGSIKTAQTFSTGKSKTVEAIPLTKRQTEHQVHTRRRYKSISLHLKASTVLLNLNTV